MRLYAILSIAAVFTAQAAQAADDPFRHYSAGRAAHVWSLGGEGDAPWLADRPYTPDTSPLAAPKATVAFRDDRVAAPAPLACAAPKYSFRLAPGPQAFEGRLKNPAIDLPTLGLSRGDVVVMDDGCGHSFYFSDPYRAVFVVGERAYSLTRDAPSGARPDDRDRLNACLALAGANFKARPPGDPAQETPTAAGRLAAAASEAPASQASCQGAVANPCVAQYGSSEVGRANCYSREQAVWDERLNATYKRLVAKAEPDVGASYKKIQRAWIAFRDARCAHPAIEMKGTMAGPMEAWCLMDETARQSLWLGGKADEN